MRVAEHVDGLRNTVRRHEGALQVDFAQPPLYLLRVGQLHPDGVYRVGRMDSKLGYYYAVALMQLVVSPFHGQKLQLDGVGLHLQIGVPRIVSFVQVGQRVAHLLRQAFVFQIGAGVMTGRKKE